MATHSSVLAWRIPGTGEPGGLLSMGLHRIRHDCSDLAAAAAVLIIASHTISRTSVHSSSDTLSDLIPGIYFSPPLYNHKGFDLGHT